ncbi:MAG: hypothetical protein KDB53_19345, partial [Planctomycetes bacterium]|nr:hypothetical protein [Planctomycetota bacterium]
MVRTSRWLGCTLPLFLMSLIASAQTTLVVGPSGTFSSIQSAISAAASGDTILVQPGTYLESISFLGKAVTVRSTDGPTVTTIDAMQLNSVVRFVSGEGPTSRLEGLTLVNGRGSSFAGLAMHMPFGGGGVLCRNASPTIKGCVIDGNEAGGSNIDPNFPTFFAGGGGGGAALENSNAVFEDCVIRNNRAGDGASEDFEVNPAPGGPGGGVFCAGGGSPRFLNCRIVGNRSGDGGAVFGISFSPIVGALGGSGGGLFADAVTTPSLVGCLFADNEAGDGSISFTAMPGPMPPGGNGGSGGGFAGAVQAVNCTLVDNEAGSAAQMIVPGQPGTGGGASGLATLVNCIVWGNQPDQISGATATFCDVQGGYAGANNGSLDPQFVDAPTGDWRLRCGSPSVNTGSTVALPAFAPSVDFEGQARVQGTAVDRGFDELASELQPGSLYVNALEASGGCGSPGFPFKTINEAVTVALPGQRILVASGTYAEAIQLTTKHLIFEGKQGPTRPIIQPPAGQSAFHLSSVPLPVVIHGFEINGASAAQGGGIHVQSTSLLLSSCRIHSNTAFGDGGGLLVEGGLVECANTVFHGNAAQGQGAAICVRSNATLDLVHATVTAHAGSNTAALVATTGASVWISNAVFWNDAGGEIAALSGASVTVENAIVDGGWAGPGQLISPLDPQFEDPNAFDFRLQALVSPGLDNGRVLLNRGQLPVTDVDGLFRQHGLPDIGAYERHDGCGAAGDPCDPASSTVSTLLPGTGEDFYLFSQV